MIPYVQSISGFSLSSVHPISAQKHSTGNYLCQEFSTGDDFVPLGTCGNVWRYYGCHKWDVGRVLLESSRYKPGLLNILQYTRQ